MRVRMSLAAALCVLAAGVSAQQAPDPRVGLKPGFNDAGVAIRNLELLSTLPKPGGFFDAAEPQGAFIPDDPLPGQAPTPGSPNIMAFANSDLAFKDQYVFVGSFHGFNIFDAENPRRPRLVASVVCPGGQGDVSVHGNLLFMSVEQTRGRVDCGTQGVTGAVSAERFRGVRIFDITNLSRPRQLAAIQTCRGSHTHTILTKAGDPNNVYIYASGTAGVRSERELAGCVDDATGNNAETALFSIDVIQVPLNNPASAKIVSRPRIFADPASGAVNSLWRGGGHGPGSQSTRATTQCHDITAFPQVGLAAGACAGNGILLDISDPANPVRIDQVTDPAFSYWHSATFNQDGTKVIFTDEWGGGTRPRCLASDPESWGANAIFEIVDRKLRFASYYKLPAAQTAQENCVAHNGSIIPVPGRDIMVQAWYQGGISVFDFTDAQKPVEIAFFDRGPIDEKNLVPGGHWSAYWYNGNIYATEISRGVDILRLTPSPLLSQNELTAALLIRDADFNAQTQTRINWPPSSDVVRAHVDQAVRRSAITAERAGAIRAALGRADAARNRTAAAPVATELRTLAQQLNTEAGPKTVADARPLWNLATALENRANALP